MFSHTPKTMPIINIQGKEHFYDEGAVINFSGGIIGFPEMRRAVLIPLTEYEPFCWLASLDDEKIRFIVVNPKRVFPDYEPEINLPDDAELEILVIVKISSDWRKTTFNLRAPIFINPKTRRAMQIILDDSIYPHAAELPNN